MFGCSNHSAGDLNGKWTTTIENRTIDLWISDTLALSFDFENELMILYRIDYDGDLLTFTNIEPYENSTWKDKIITLKQNEFELELQNSSNNQITKYSRTNEDLPELSTDYEVNFERYENYLVNRKYSR